MKIVPFIIVFLLAASNSFSQTALCELTISTITSNGLLLPNVRIDLFFNDSILIKSTNTDANGRVQIDSLNEGTYLIKASKEEYYGIDHYKVSITI